MVYLHKHYFKQAPGGRVTQPPLGAFVLFFPNIPIDLNIQLAFLHGVRSSQVQTSCSSKRAVPSLHLRRQ